ncbi:hypothetical protein U9M48_005491 [Paspalum notatum var. saurae]|uniref:Uncharacterized protein n=1 Tax=Paspalum notatum var. saurae TaxID=547442 RepID=A0AAQ3SK17_PASNO
MGMARAVVSSPASAHHRTAAHAPNYHPSARRRYKFPPRLSSTLHRLQISSKKHILVVSLGEATEQEGMGRVHPNPDAPSASTSSRVTPGEEAVQVRAGAEEEEPSAVSVLTVWRKSLLFGCHGFTVFDARGDLAFRVDCYAASRRRSEVVLMGAAGEPLLTVRRARRLGGLLASDRWVIYDGDGATATPLLSVRRAGAPSASSNKALAHVTPLSGAGAGYVVEGSYGRRACAVRDARGGGSGGAAVAEVRRKEAVGDDVFRLVAGPRLGAPLAMGLVIALDEMFGGARSSASSLLRRTWSA